MSSPSFHYDVHKIMLNGDLTSLYLVNLRLMRERSFT